MARKGKGKGKDEAGEPDLSAMTPEERAEAAFTRATTPPQMRLADHPRARAGVGRFKAWGGLLGLVVVGFLASRTDLPAFEIWWRALLGGIVGYLAGWALGLVIWRPIVRLEADRNAQQLAERHKEAIEQYERRLNELKEARDRKEAEKAAEDAEAGRR